MLGTSVTFQTQADVANFAGSNCTWIWSLEIKSGSQGDDPVTDLGAAGLENLTEILGNLYIHDVPLLMSLRGLDGLRTVSENLRIENAALLGSLDGLQGITSIGASLVIVDLPVLKSLDGLEGISTIGKDSDGQSIRLDSLWALQSLSALRNVAGALPGSLVIKWANNLKSLDGLGHHSHWQG